MNKYIHLAAQSSLGRRHFPKEKEHSIRDPFERDRDRILYSKEFRRLSGKTQVFVAGFDDDLRTRLTHTLEVAQIAKTICRATGLNEILAEAIALGHDVGHTPFGHVGERALNQILNGCEPFKKINMDLPADQRGFKHNWQSVRVVCDLEKINSEYEGLNLTDFTIWGILNHSNTNYKPCEYLSEDSCTVRRGVFQCPNVKSPNPRGLGFYQRYSNRFNEQSWSIEALVVKQADEIAQRCHDIQDGLFSGILDQRECIKGIIERFHSFMEKPLKTKLRDLEKEKNRSFLTMSISQGMVNFFVTRFIKDLTINLEELTTLYKITSSDDFHAKKEQILANGIDYISSYRPPFSKPEKEFQKFLFSRIVSSFTAQRMDGKADFIIRQLMKCYLYNPQQLPDSTIIKLYRNLTGTRFYENANNSFSKIVGEVRERLTGDHRKISNTDFIFALLRTCTDYIAGMTDKYAMEQFHELYEAGSDRAL